MAGNSTGAGAGGSGGSRSGGPAGGGRPGGGRSGGSGRGNPGGGRSGGSPSGGSRSGGARSGGARSGGSQGWSDRSSGGPPASGGRGRPADRAVPAGQAVPAGKAVPAGQEVPRTKAEPAGADPAVPEAAALALPATGSRSPGSRTPALAVLAVDLQTGRPGLVTTRLAAVVLHPPAAVGARRQGRVLARAADPVLVMAQPPAAGQRPQAPAADQRRVTAPVVAAGRRPATAPPLAAGQSRPAAAGTGRLAEAHAHRVLRRRGTALAAVTPGRGTVRRPAAATGRRAETPAQAARHRPDTAPGAVTLVPGTVSGRGRDSGSGDRPSSGYRSGGRDSGSGYRSGGRDAASGDRPASSGYRSGGRDSGSGYRSGGRDAGSGDRPASSGYRSGGRDSGSGDRPASSGYRSGARDSGSGDRPASGGRDWSSAAVRVHPVPRRLGTVPAVATPGPAIVPQRAAGQELATAQALVVRRGPTNGLVPTAAGQAGRAAATGPGTRPGAAQVRAELQAARTRAADGGRRAIPVLAAGATTTVGRTATEVRHGPPTGGAGRRGGTGRGRLAEATTASVAASPAAPAIAAVQMATAATATADPALRATIEAPSTRKPAPTSCASPYRTALRRSSLIRRRRPSCGHCPATWPASSRGCSLPPASRRTLTRPTGTRRRLAASQPESASSGRHAPSPLIRPVTGMLP